MYETEMDFEPKRESKSQLGWFKDFKIFSGRNIVRVAHQSGMKINGCSCSFVFAVFNNLNKTRVHFRSCSIFHEKPMFVFVRVRYFHQKYAFVFCSRSCSCSL